MVGSLTAAVIAAAADPSFWQPLGFALLTLLGIIVAAFASIRLVKPQAKQIVSTAGDLDSQRWERLLQRYEAVVADQDERLERFQTRIDELERAEHECEQRADQLQDEITTLKRVLRDHGIDIPQQ